MSKSAFQRIMAGLEQARKWTKGDDSGMHACYCVGPINGQPHCPCHMRHVRDDDRAGAPEGDLTTFLVDSLDRELNGGEAAR